MALALFVMRAPPRHPAPPSAAEVFVRAMSRFDPVHKGLISQRAFYWEDESDGEFEHFDANHDGMINVEEFYQAYFTRDYR